MNTDEIEVSPDESVSLSRKASVISTVDHDIFVESTKSQRRTVTVEPIVMFYIIVLYIQMSVLNQYVYYRVGVDHNITHDGHLAYVCNRNDNSSEEKDKADKLQDLNSSYMMFIALSSAVCSIMTAPFYSVFSDRFGRRLLFFLPGFGTFLKSIFEVLIIIFDWPLYCFYLTEGLFGLFGGFNFALGLSYSYIADISSSKTRTKRLSILVSMMGIGALLVSLVTGYWISLQGYIIPYAFSAVISLLCLIYPLVWLQEPPRMVEASKVHLPPLKQLRTLISIYLGRPRHESVILILMVVMFNFYYIAEMSNIGIITTYLMSFPICMTSIQMGFFSFSNLLAINIGVFLSVVVISRFISELYIVIICHLSGLCFTLQMAFASSPTAVYIAAVSNLFSYSAFQFIRGFLSKQVGPFEQGALFGGLVLSETIGGAITKVVVMYFYKHTFHILHGMVFLFVSCFSVVALILTLITIILSRKDKNSFGFKTLN